jgi:murein DD-endopeptidase MepM/ murein hydrolase activator NlpD
MRLLLCALACVAGLTSSGASLGTSLGASTEAQTAPLDPCVEFDRLYAQIRDGHVARAAALPQIRILLPRIRAYFDTHGGRAAPRDTWRFPLEGYGAGDIGGTRGSGYVADGYDYFDGYNSHGHPGHDIFIHDRNQDELDDGTGKPVNVLSISSGVVVAEATDWAPDSVLRGGRYVYIYDPLANGMFYYAHNRSVLVKPGDIVRPGQIIATAGRSGRNAAAPRSPTHLHVMFLAMEDGYPRPRDIYPDLLRLGHKRQ